MRTIKLTHEQIALIQNALGIAEQQYLAQHKQIIELSNVRYNEANRKAQNAIGLLCFEQSNEFCDLNIDIQSGVLDV